jgi:hypothetical protein
MKSNITFAKRTPVALIYRIFILLTIVTVINAAPATEAISLDKRLLGTCIDLCKEPNFVNCYTVCTDADVCTTLNPALFYSDGVSSINFSGSTVCWVYDEADCQGDSRSLPVNQPNMAGSAFDDMTKSFFCHRENKKIVREIEAVASDSSNTKLVTKDTGLLGTCIDLCLDINFVNCWTICTDADVVTNTGSAFADNGVSSVNFQGSTHCWLYEEPNAIGRSVYLGHAVSDMRDLNFNDMTRSFVCDRPN